MHAVAIALPVQRSRVEEADETRAQHAHPVPDHRAAPSSFVDDVSTEPTRYLAAAKDLLDRLESQSERRRPGRDALCRRDRRGRARPPLRHRPLPHPGRGDVPALRLLSRLPSDRGALDDLPHAGRRRERPAPGDVHRAGRRARRDDPRQLRARAAGRDDRLQRRRADRGADRDCASVRRREACRSSP